MAALRFLTPALAVATCHAFSASPSTASLLKCKGSNGMALAASRGKSVAPKRPSLHALRSAMDVHSITSAFDAAAAASQHVDVQSVFQLAADAKDAVEAAPEVGAEDMTTVGEAAEAAASELLDPLGEAATSAAGKFQGVVDLAKGVPVIIIPIVGGVLIFSIIAWIITQT